MTDSVSPRHLRSKPLHRELELDFIRIRGVEIGIGVLTTRLCEIPALRLRDRLFPRRVDTPVGPPAVAEAPDAAAAHL